MFVTFYIYIYIHIYLELKLRKESGRGQSASHSEDWKGGREVSILVAGDSPTNKLYMV